MNFKGYYLAGGFALAVAGCAGSGVPSASPAHSVQGDALNAPAGPAASATTGQANDKDVQLVYESDVQDGYILGMKWRGFLGKIQINMEGTQGLCSDAAGNLFVPRGSVTLEYPHDSSKVIATLENTGEGIACAVDPGNGALAVINESLGSSATSIDIFKHAKGTPTSYSLPNIASARFGGYDAKGNLFVDGSVSGSTGFGLAELASKASTFIPVTVSQTIGAPAAIQWDGKYLAIGDASQDYGSSTIYQVSVTNNVATVVGSTTLQQAGCLRQFVTNHNLIFATSGCGVRGYWKYPGGGQPIKSNYDEDREYGVALSLE